MQTISPALLTLFQTFATAGVVTFLVNVIKPALEKTAFVAPTSSAHDAVVRLVNLALNVALALGIAAALSQLQNGPEALLAIGLGVAQAGGSHFLYATGGSSSASTSATLIASGTATLASASTTIAAPTADEIAAAVSAALAPKPSA